MQKEASIEFLLDHIFRAEGIAAVDYDIFLAHDVDNIRRLEERITLYNAIGAACERLNLKPFIPYRFLKSNEWGDLSFRDMYTLLHRIMISSTNLFLCDLSTVSTSIREMKDTAIRLKKPQIYFYEKGRIAAEGYANILVRNNSNIKGILEYSTIRGCIKTLEAVIRSNFDD